MKRLMCLASLLLFTLVTSGVFAVPLADPRAPDIIVEETTRHILSSLIDRNDEFTQYPERLRELVNNDMLSLIDTEYSARLILGRAGRGATPEQISAFAVAMSENLLNRYTEGLLEINANRQVEVLPLKGKNTEKLTRVRTRLTLDSGSQVPIDFAFRKTDLGWKAFDITIEGISYVMTYRNQISPLVLAEGIDKVTADLQKGNISLEE